MGRLDLQDATGAPFDDLLRQPKRVALLLYLVLAEPAGLRRRDALLALFWPDLDTLHARAALRKTLYVLRGALGPDVILTRGDDEVGVDPGQFDCDAIAFAAALTKGDIPRALERYRGDLLAGYFVSEASPEWEQWLDARRAGLRTRAVEAAWQHAAGRVEAGELSEGAKWARWASGHAPDDEAGIRRLLELLGSMGDRAGVMQVYEEFRSRLRREYDVAPDPKTQALVAASGSRTARPPPLVPVTTAEPAVASTIPLETPHPAPRARRSWKPAMLLMPVLGAAAAAIVLARRTQSPQLQPDLVVVAPFTALSANLTLWQEGIVDLLARNLDGAGPLKVVPPSPAIRVSEGRVADVASATRLGRSTGAGLVVFGSLLGLAGDSTRLSATVLDVSTGRSIGDVEIRGSLDRMDLVVDSLTRGLLRVVGQVRQIGSARLTGIGSRSVPALKAFLRGEQFRRRTSWDSAQVLYEEAVALDSTFALAWLRLGEVYATTQFPVPLASGPTKDNPWHVIYRAGTVNHGLARHDSLMVVAAAGVAGFELNLVPDAEARATAARVYQSALEMARLYPEDAEAWYAVAVVQDFLGGLVNTTNAVTYRSYSRAMGLDSGFAPAYRMALRIAGDAGDVTGTQRIAEHYLTLNPPASSRAIPFLIARLLHPATDSTAARRLLDSTATVMLWPGLLAIWLLPDTQEAAVRVAREIASREHDPRYWFTADFIVRRNLAAVLAYRGHLREALALSGDERSTWFANVFPELTVWGAVPAPRADSVFVDWLMHHTDAHGLPFSRWWWAVRRDTTALLRFRSLPSRGGPSDLAFLELGRRDTAEALRQFTAWREDHGSDYFGLLAMVRLLVAGGKRGEALTILNGREPNDWPLPSHVVWALERARLLELSGDRDAAQLDYQFVADVWRHADPDLQSLVAEARTAVRRLGGDRAIESEPVRGRTGLPGAARESVAGHR